MIVSTILSAPPSCPAGLSQAQGLVATLQRWWVTYTAWRIERLATSRLLAKSHRLSRRLSWEA